MSVRVAVTVTLLVIVLGGLWWWAVDETPMSSVAAVVPTGSTKPSAGMLTPEGRALPETPAPEPTSLVAVDAPTVAVDTVEDGPFAVGPTSYHSLTVVDAALRTLPDAFLLMTGDSFLEAREADADGLIRWLVRSPMGGGQRSVYVAAPRHRPATFDVSSLAELPQRVVLQSATMLDVHLDVRAQPAPSRLSVSVHSSGELFEDVGMDRDSSVIERLDAFVFSITDDSGSTVWLFEDQEDGNVFTAYGVMPGVELTVRAEGVAGEKLAEEVVVLSPGEQRVLTLVITERARTLSGLVTDPDGLPAARATVNLRSDNGSDMRSQIETTDTEGVYLFENLASQFVSLMVARDGAARYEAADIDLDARSVHDIPLQAGTPFALHIVHELSRRPVEFAQVWSRWGKFSSQRGVLDEPGVWSVPGLPERSTEVNVYHRGDMYSVTRDPGQSEATLLVAETVDVTVTGLDADTGDRLTELFARRVAGGERAQVRVKVVRDGSKSAILGEITPGTWDVVWRHAYYGSDVLARGRFTCGRSGSVSVHLVPEPSGSAASR